MPHSAARALRIAAQQVLAAWDHEAGGRAGLAEAIAALRSALPPALLFRRLREPGSWRTPRTGGRQEAVLALPRRVAGASCPRMMEVTGWALHTLRGFLASLKKRGFEVLVHGRVRQVGHGEEGAC